MVFVRGMIIPDTMNRMSWGGAGSMGLRTRKGWSGRRMSVLKMEKLVLHLLPCGNGIDGNLTVSSPNVIVNSYTYLNSNHNSQATIINVQDGQSFSNGDEILLIQMQHNDEEYAGTHEFKTVSSGGGTNSFVLNQGLENDYFSSSFNTNPSFVTQIVKVPQYQSVSINSGCSITALGWDGYIGGIVVLYLFS